MKNKLISELKKAAKAYYHGAAPVMSDEEYDLKLEALEELLTDEDFKNDEIKSLFTSPSAGTTSNKNLVEHDVPMLSLAKAKNEEELLSYHKRLVANGAKGFKLQAKLDGIALSAMYNNGKLIRLTTRGDGVRGENISYLVESPELTIMYLPKVIDYKGKLELRGEIYASDKQFEEFSKNRFEALGGTFSNSRNAVSGILTKAKGGLGYRAELTFATYSTYKDAKPIEIEEVEKMGLNGIKPVYQLTEEIVKELDSNALVEVDVNFDKLNDAVLRFGELRESFAIPTDGVVIKPTNEVEMLNKMGYTSHHPIANIAYKYPGGKAITTVEEITVTVGKTGRLTPQARVKPVEVDGVVITNITCHNYNWLYDMGIREGSTVAVTRANDVIPAISVVIDEGDHSMPKIPNVCPECGGALKGDGLSIPKTLVCASDLCPSKTLYYMKSVVSRQYLHIDGMGDVLMEALSNANMLNNLYDLFTLTSDDLANVTIGETSIGNERKLGKVRADKIIASIQNAKNNTSSNKLLASLNIPGVGPNTAQKLIEHFGGLESLINTDYARLYEVDGIGETIVSSFVNHGIRIKEELNELLSLGVRINDVLPDNKEVVGTFSVSGSVEGFANRGEFVKHMENLGWKFHRTPKKDTDVLFADPNGTSSKIKKAKSNGTRIIKSLSDL